MSFSIKWWNVEYNILSVVVIRVHGSCSVVLCARYIFFCFQLTINNYKSIILHNCTFWRKEREKNMSLKWSIKRLRKQFKTVRIFFLRNQFNFYFGGILASTFYDRRATDLKQNPWLMGHEIKNLRWCVVRKKQNQYKRK